ncbi:thioredoxin domain-containing protein [Phyllobacterium phragmitis]|uniref:Thioredoxin domain-containing protein n=1 Tax=Phyllobacterium phragmitis TaxID=2670329 RepID=A0ABQ0GU93_9HYPH
MPILAENRLSDQPSAYLRQHADNPVHWQPWGREALDEARRTGRPILLSVGYAACHWCHVMAHECFEDREVARVMNDLFVNVKVDREERPDIDQIYMAALTAIGEQGGWPLTMFLTPEGQPFWGGTYFPKHARYGRPGFIDVLHAIHRTWIADKESINHNVAALSSHIAQRLAATASPSPLDRALSDRFADQVHSMMDLQHGGIRGAPKFPNAPFMDALWLSWLRNGNVAHRDAFLLSLEIMLQGGIYDHLGGGLARYSVDDRWLVPHFEKMLYDNAQMLRHASWAYAETGHPLFRTRIEETIAWLQREMHLPNGTFASSLDADSEGEEGKFYLWTAEEIDAVLPDASLFKTRYDVAPEGNWEGKTILNRLRSRQPDSAEEETALKAGREKLLAIREKRVRPGRDDKALTDWNGLLIRALAEAARVFEREDWADIAKQAYRSISESMREGRPPHSVMDGAKLFPALSTDYAAMINAALSLYQIDGDKTYIEDAQHFLAQLDDWHLAEDGGYSLSASDADDLILRIRGDQDEAVPSATSQIIEALTRLGIAAGEQQLQERAVAVAEHAIGRIRNLAYGQAGIINAASLVMDPWKLVIVAPDRNHLLVAEANRIPDPRRVDVVMPVGNDPAEAGLPQDILPDMTKPAAYLCRGLVCLPPVETAEELHALLVEKS